MLKGIWFNWMNKSWGADNEGMNYAAVWNEWSQRKTFSILQVRQRLQSPPSSVAGQMHRKFNLIMIFCSSAATWILIVRSVVARIACFWARPSVGHDDAMITVEHREYTIATEMHSTSDILGSWTMLGQQQRHAETHVLALHLRFLKRTLYTVLLACSEF